MLHNAGQLMDERLQDTLRVLIPNGAVIAAVNVMTFRGWAELGLICISIAYTVWRWRRDSYVICQACRDGHVPESCAVKAGKRPGYCPKRDS